MTDNEFMMEAVKEGRLAQGKTGTNPPVGAILVKDGKIIGRGHTSELGGPHAEVNAIKDAGEEAKGSTVYCTLEPCSHWGRTGPCCEALEKAKVSRVFVGISDPFPKVNGRGVQYLRNHGIEVKVGYCEDVIKNDLKDFLAWAKEQSKS